jgi:osmotically inducible lipoprotein OsmB
VEEGGAPLFRLDRVGFLEVVRRNVARPDRSPTLYPGVWFKSSGRIEKNSSGRQGKQYGSGTDVELARHFRVDQARDEMATRNFIMRRILAAAGVAAISLALAGCGQTPGCRAATGAGLGAAGGAALGAIGGNPVAGAVAGGVAGAAVGGLTSPDQVNAGPAPCY